MDHDDPVDDPAGPAVPQTPTCPFGASYPARPHQTLDELRGGCPVARVRTAAGRPVWLVTEGALVRAGFTNPRFAMRSRPPATSDDQQRALAVTVVDHDGPHHARLRRLAAPSLTPHRVAAFRPAAEHTAGRLLASLGGAARIELMADFAHRFAFEVFCDLFAIEPAARTDLFDWVSLAFSPAGRGRKGRANFDRIERFMTAEVERRLRQPGDDVMSAIVTAGQADAEVSRNEVISLCATLLLAGFETAPQMMGMSVVALLTHPDELAWLRADLSRMSVALDELLRFNTPGPSSTLRVALEDVDVAGTVIPAGDRVLLSIDATNHDPADHADPHRLDLRRSTATRHLTFGLGPHYCPGSPLARMELTVALTALLRRYPRLALAVPVDELPWRGSHLNRGLAALPLDTGEPTPAPDRTDGPEPRVEVPTGDPER